MPQLFSNSLKLSIINAPYKTIFHANFWFFYGLLFSEYIQLLWSYPPPPESALDHFRAKIIQAQDGPPRPGARAKSVASGNPGGHPLFGLPIRPQQRQVCTLALVDFRWRLMLRISNEHKVDMTA